MRYFSNSKRSLQIPWFTISKPKSAMDSMNRGSRLLRLFSVSCCTLLSNRPNNPGGYHLWCTYIKKKVGERWATRYFLKLFLSGHQHSAPSNIKESQGNDYFTCPNQRDTTGHKCGMTWNYNATTAPPRNDIKLLSANPEGLQSNDAWNGTSRTDIKQIFLVNDDLQLCHTTRVCNYSKLPIAVQSATTINY